MGAAGAPFPYFITFVEPASAFNLLVAVMAIAVPMIGWYRIVDRSGHWWFASRHNPGNCYGQYLLGAEFADRRCCTGRFYFPGATGDYRFVSRFHTFHTQEAKGKWLSQFLQLPT